MKMVEVQKGSNWCVAYFSDMENSEISDFRIFIFLVILIIKLFKKYVYFTVTVILYVTPESSVKPAKPA